MPLWEIIGRDPRKLRSGQSMKVVRLNKREREKVGGSVISWCEDVSEKQWGSLKPHAANNEDQLSWESCGVNISCGMQGERCGFVTP